MCGRSQEALLQMRQLDDRLDLGDELASVVTATGDSGVENKCRFPASAGVNGPWIEVRGHLTSSIHFLAA